MHAQLSLAYMMSASVMIACVCPALSQAQTSFTYQGRLTDLSGLPSTGMHDLRFTLYTAASGGSSLGPVLCVENVAVDAEGVFAARLDFGAQFDGSPRFLLVEVRADPGQSLPCANPGGFTALTPRQQIESAPQAAFALAASTATSATTAVNATNLAGQPASFYTNAGNLASGTLASARFGGTYSNILSLSNASNSISGTFTGSGAALTGLNAANVSTGTLADVRLSTNIPRLNTANSFTAGNTFGAVGVGLSPAHPVDVSTGSQTVMNLLGSNTGGSWLNLRNTSTGGRTWNFITAGSANSEAAGSFFIRDSSAGVRLLIDPSGNLGLGTITPGARLEVSAADAAVNIRNVNDPGGGFLLDSFGTLQLGMYNPGAGAWNAIPAAGRRSLFGVSSTGRVGSLTNTGNSPTFRNTLDDGSGGASIAGSLTVSSTGQFGSQVAIGGSIGGESLRIYGGMLQDQDTNGPGFFTLSSARTNGPEIHLVNAQTNGKLYRLRNVGAGATSALVFDNFTDIRELLRLNRLGSATLGGGLTANGGVDAHSFLMDQSNVSIELRNFTSYFNMSSGATGSSPGMRVFQSGYNNDPSYAAQFTPDVQVTRALLATSIAAGVKLFTIDHPLDPDNRVLRHACVESDQMVNLYRGNATLDGAGRATVSMPQWLDALNTDFTYVLTPVGRWAPLYIESEIENGNFTIAGGTPGMKVSWQVSGVRKDEFALRSPLEVEGMKRPEQRGKRLYEYPTTGAQLAPVTTPSENGAN